MSRDIHLEVDHVSHSYTADSLALDDVSLEIAAGELVTFVGPSGCGKTTLLRIIGGFITPTAGRIRLNGVDLVGLPPNKRPTNLVFQRPTLFPHLDVEANVAFGLKLARIAKAERRSRVADAIDLLHLNGLEKRRTFELSGGQMQRVALARALVNRPEVLLLDEPLSALDMQIRIELEVELRRVHRETGSTFLYVTHDQREALALADRVVVFDHGRIAQVGTSEEIYQSPRSPYVAKFVGDANVLAAEVRASRLGRSVFVGDTELAQTDEPFGDCTLVLRAEDVTVTSVPGPESIECQIIDRVFRGSTIQYRLAIVGNGTVIKVDAAASDDRHDLGAVVGVRCSGTCVVLPASPRASASNESGTDD